MSSVGSESKAQGHLVGTRQECVTVRCTPRLQIAPPNSLPSQMMMPNPSCSLLSAPWGPLAPARRQTLPEPLCLPAPCLPSRVRPALRLPFRSLKSKAGLGGPMIQTQQGPPSAGRCWSRLRGPGTDSVAPAPEGAAQCLWTPPRARPWEKARGCSQDLGPS